MTTGRINQITFVMPMYPVTRSENSSFRRTTTIPLVVTPQCVPNAALSSHHHKVVSSMHTAFTTQRGWTKLLVENNEMVKSDWPHCVRHFTCQVRSKTKYLCSEASLNKSPVIKHDTSNTTRRKARGFKVARHHRRCLVFKRRVVTNTTISRRIIYQRRFQEPSQRIDCHRFALRNDKPTNSIGRNNT